MQSETKLKEFRPVAQEPIEIEDRYPVQMSPVESWEDFFEWSNKIEQEQRDRLDRIVCENGIIRERGIDNL